MKAVILRFAPDAQLVDITHAVPPQDVARGAFELEAAWRYFPAGTIFLAVVDPGVGTARRPVALSVAGSGFVGPDNGLFSGIVRWAGGDSQSGTVTVPEGAAAWTIDADRHGLRPLSATFHGRDVFAPVAGKLAAGLAWDDIGTPLPSIVDLPGGGGRIVAIDHFGNLITNVRPEPGEELAVQVAGRRLSGVKRTYGEGDGLLLLVGSSGFLEIAVRDGSAAALLGCQAGDPIQVERQGLENNDHD